MKHLKSRKKIGFRNASLHRVREPHAMHYLKQRTSFWIATLCIFAFLVGNMMGQHGWHAFWASVLGKTDDSLIAYTGTASPVALVPDYDRWHTFGGNPEDHTYRQVPADILVPLPVYHYATAHENAVYSVGHLGSYTSGEDSSGSHPGVDIRVPIGTPVLAIANGVVAEVKEGGGFGKVIVLRHPNVPDPGDPKKTTVLYSNYAHLSMQYVAVGAIVQKGDQIGLSGSTGYVSGPHLHFQIDTADAPWHPYWPFTDAEARAVGMTTVQAVNAALHQERGKLYTVSPLLYVQANYPSPPDIQTRVLARGEERRARGGLTRQPVILVAQEPSSPSGEVSAEVRPAAPEVLATSAQLMSRAEERAAMRRARMALRPTITTVAKAGDSTEERASVTIEQDVVSVSFRHDGVYRGREWETIRVSLLDGNGYTILNPNLQRDLSVRTAYGDADFQPKALSALDFENGIAEIHVLPRGRRTLVFKLEPLPTLSSPMRFEQ